MPLSKKIRNPKVPNLWQRGIISAIVSHFQEMIFIWVFVSLGQIIFFRRKQYFSHLAFLRSSNLHGHILPNISSKDVSIKWRSVQTFVTLGISPHSCPDLASDVCSPSCPLVLLFNIFQETRSKDFESWNFSFSIVRRELFALRRANKIGLSKEPHVKQSKFQNSVSSDSPLAGKDRNFILSFYCPERDFD